jgi:hypothetical protein
MFLSIKFQERRLPNMALLKECVTLALPRTINIALLRSEDRVDLRTPRIGWEWFTSTMTHFELRETHLYLCCGMDSGNRGFARYSPDLPTLEICENICNPKFSSN